MTGSIKGCVARFSEYVSKGYDNMRLSNLHCIIHQEALCVKSVALDDTLKDVNRIILYIRANALPYRQFREILQLSETSAEDILYHTAVRWLSQGETSRPVLHLRKEILFHKKQKLPITKFQLPYIFGVSGGFSVPREQMLIKAYKEKQQQYTACTKKDWLFVTNVVWLKIIFNRTIFSIFLN